MTEVYHGRTHKSKTKGGSLYVTLNWEPSKLCEECGGGGELLNFETDILEKCQECYGEGILPPKPKEVFIKVGKAGSEQQAYNEALGRVISLHLQKGGTLNGIYQQLSGISAETSYAISDSSEFRSTPDSIAQALFALLVEGPPYESKRHLSD